jgi:hypothetical protein
MSQGNSSKNRHVRAAVLAYFDGNVARTVRAMKRDGIMASSQTVKRILEDDKVKKALSLQAVAAPGQALALYNREDLQKFWQDIMTAPAREVVEDENGAKLIAIGPTIAERLKASELMGKSMAAFTEKVEHSGQINLGIAALLDMDLRVKANEGEKAQ